MKKLLLGLLAGLAFTGCEPLEGVLVTNQPIQLKDRSGDKITITGQQHIKLKMNQESKMKLILHLSSGRHVIPIKTNFNVSDIRNGDKIFIPASFSGQPYDISGIYHDQYTTSDRYSSVESCSWNTHQTVCENVLIKGRCITVTECNPNNPSQCKTRQKCDNDRYERQCRDLVRTHYGQQDVTFHYSNNSVNFDINLISNGKIVAQLSPNRSASSKIYDYKGLCY